MCKMRWERRLSIWVSWVGTFRFNLTKGVASYTLSLPRQSRTKEEGSNMSTFGMFRGATKTAEAFVKGFAQRGCLRQSANVTITPTNQGCPPPAPFPVHRSAVMARTITARSQLGYVVWSWGHRSRNMPALLCQASTAVVGVTTGKPSNCDNVCHCQQLNRAERPHLTQRTQVGTARHGTARRK